MMESRSDGGVEPHPALAKSTAQTWAANFFWTLLLSATLFASPANSSGDPTVNLPRFFEYAFISQMMTADEINAAQTADATKRKEPASQPNRQQELLGLRRRNLPSIDSELRCADFHLASYSAFLAAFGEDAAHESFINWAKPAQATSRFQYLLGFFLWSYEIQVAVLGGKLSANEVIDARTNTIADKTLRETLKVRGYDLDVMYERYISGRKVTLITATECDGFVIFEINVK